MEIYRITSEKFQEIDGTGGLLFPGRWHLKGSRVVYASEYRSLAALEALVHLSKPILLQAGFALLTISVPDNPELEVLPEGLLTPHWNNFEYQKDLQTFGTKFLNEIRGLLLKVPSVIISQEFNYLLNPLHPQFEKCCVVKTERFAFDNRFSDVL